MSHAEPIQGENRPLLDADLGIYRFDDLVVLKQTDMPALLLEAGITVNRDEELTLTHPAFRQRLAAGVVSAIETYCAEH